MNRPGPIVRSALVLAALLATSGGFARAQAARDGGLPGPTTIQRDVGFDQKLGAQVPLDLEFLDSNGRSVRIGDYLGSRPAVLALVYHRCPMLCSEVLNGLVRGLRPVAQKVGVDFDVIVASIDPDEDPNLAARAKAKAIADYGRPESAPGWHFLRTDDPSTIDKLAGSVGFRFVKDPRTGQFWHAAGVVVLTPEGVVSHYDFGADYSPRDLQAGLRKADGGEVGSPIAKLLLLCYDYDPSTGRYTLTVMSVLRGLGIVTILALTFTIGGFLLAERRRRPMSPPAAAPAAD